MLEPRGQGAYLPGVILLAVLPLGDRPVVIGKLLAAALTQPHLVGAKLRSELERLERGGYLSAEEVRRVREEGTRAVQENLGQARTLAEPWLEALAATLRRALDLPSRGEVEALRREVESLRATEPRRPAG